MSSAELTRADELRETLASVMQFWSRPQAESRFSGMGERMDFVKLMESDARAALDASHTALCELTVEFEAGFPHLDGVLADKFETFIVESVRCTDSFIQDFLVKRQELVTRLDLGPSDRVELVQACSHRVETSTEFLKVMTVHFPATLDMLSAEVRKLVLTYRIPWWANLLSMANLFWSAVRHPWSETTIDLSTGRVLYRN